MKNVSLLSHDVTLNLVPHLECIRYTRISQNKSMTDFRHFLHHSEYVNLNWCSHPSVWRSFGHTLSTCTKQPLDIYRTIDTSKPHKFTLSIINRLFSQLFPGPTGSNGCWRLRLTRVFRTAHATRRASFLLTYRMYWSTVSYS